MASRNYRRTGKTVLGLETTTRELERFEFENGALRVTGGGGGEVKEKPFSSHTQQIYAFDPTAPELGEAIPDDIPCEGFMLTTPLANTGVIWVGDSPTTCYVGLPAGAVKMCALQNANQVYAFCTGPEGAADQILIVERYFD